MLLYTDRHLKPRRYADMFKFFSLGGWKQLATWMLMRTKLSSTCMVSRAGLSWSRRNYHPKLQVWGSSNIFQLYLAEDRRVVAGAKKKNNMKKHQNYTICEWFVQMICELSRYFSFAAEEWQSFPHELVTSTQVHGYDHPAVRLGMVYGNMILLFYSII